MQRLFKLWRIFVGAIFILQSEQMTLARIRQTVLRFALTFTGFMAILPAISAHAQKVPNTLSCGSKFSIDLGTVLAGGTLRDTLFLFNQDSDRDSIFEIKTLPDTNFSWTDPSSIHILLDSTRDWTTISFTSSKIGLAAKTIVIEPTADTDSCQTTCDIIATVVGPDTDGAIVQLDSGSKDIIAFKSDTSNQTLQIQLQNNYGHSIFTKTLQIQDTTAFSIDKSSIIPDSLADRAIFTLKLRFTAKSLGFYTDFIRSPDEPILPISIQGLLLHNDAVKTQPITPVYFVLYPNPSNGPVTIHTKNISQAHVGITDVLGRTLTEASFTGDWQWDRTGTNGIAPSGTYFVIVSGIGMNGEPVHEIKRVVLE